jgi:hypothetical protein
MVELPKKQYGTLEDMGPYNVAARYCTKNPNNDETNSTIVEHDGQLIELFGITQQENQPLPHGYTMRATIIKKYINHRVRCMIVELSETEE